MKQPQESDSELQHWKSSEEVHPSETQTRIKCLIEDADKDLDELEDKMNDLYLEIRERQSVLDELHLQQQADVTRIHILRSAISSIKKIPVEILSEIFVYYKMRCCNHYGIDLPLNEYRYNWVLAHVSRRWRRVFWSTPEMWSRIGCEKSHYAHSPIIYHILSNARGLIDLSLAQAGGIKIISDIICRFPGRFKRLEMNGDQFYRLCDLLKPMGQDHSFFSLEELSIVYSNLNKHQIPPNPAIPVLLTTVLKKVSLGQYYGYSKSQQCPPLLPWTQLVDLDLWDINLPPGTLHSILSKCNSVVTCKMCITHETPQLAVDHKDIALHKLKSLSFRVCEGSSLDHFLQPFIFTGLEELSISTRFCPWLEKPVVELIQRSNCYLKQIWMENCSRLRKFEFIDVSSLLRVTPSLADLNISGEFAVLPSTFERILSDGLVPCIKYLECYTPPEGVHAFLDLMEYYNLQGPSNGIQMAFIVCLKDPGLDEARVRFDSLVSKYEVDGRVIRFQDSIR